MRAYLPLTWAQLRTLEAAGHLEGPLRACAVDPAWRAGSPEVDEEQWEFEAQACAAEDLAGPEAGVVLAVDVEQPEGPLEDGWFTTGALQRTQSSALLTADLAWYGMQEVAALLAEAQAQG